ncbi:hypothetical protein [Pajaroellobacter abortibovis]|uniref:Uncharacterized protein n=1 Tax=Pajaroellobacter abortibovis TaxID=1882918 RepID=A0A1L6MVK0_9BACT|nr:hypothetical protein [Pajaroellobacter abortibovis]APR99573.1 hypothetical protein BCY86_01915 [Pajaroellobacter abortibovis]
MMFLFRKDRLFFFIGVSGSAFSLLACGRSVGDPCRQLLDCSSQGPLVCDTSQVGGYCTIFLCSSQEQECPEQSICVLPQAVIPGCPYDDRRIPLGAVDRCMRTCDSDSDCRSGYVCASPISPPWFGRVMQGDPTRSVCLPAPSFPVDSEDGSAGEGGQSVCTSWWFQVPPIDAGPQRAYQQSDASGLSNTDAGVMNAPF